MPSIAATSGVVASILAAPPRSLLSSSKAKSGMHSRASPSGQSWSSVSSEAFPRSPRTSSLRSFANCSWSSALSVEVTASAVVAVAVAVEVAVEVVVAPVSPTAPAVVAPSVRSFPAAGPVRSGRGSGEAGLSLVDESLGALPLFLSDAFTLSMTSASSTITKISPSCASTRPAASFSSWV